MENGDLFVSDVTGDPAPSEIHESSSNVDQLEETSTSRFLADSEGTTGEKDKELESSSSSEITEIPESSSNVDRLEEASTSRFLADSEGTTGEKDKELESASSSTQQVKDSQEHHVHFDTPLEDLCASNDHQLDGATSGASLCSHQTPSSGTASSRGFYADFENTSGGVEKSSAGYRKLSITLTDQWLSVRKAVESRRPASSIDSTVTEEMKRRYREMLQRKRKVWMMQRTRDDKEIRIMKRNKFHHKFYFSDSHYPESTEYSTTSSSTAEVVSMKEVEEMSADSPHVTTGRLQRIWRRCGAAIRGLCCCLGKDEN